MAREAGNRSAADLRREASAWIARLRGPDADRFRLDFERWRAASPRHREIYAEMEQISHGTRALGATALGDVYAGLAPRRPLFARPALRLAMAGIALLLVAGSALLLFDRTGPRPASGGTVQAIASATGQLRRLRLPDGSAVILDTDTRIEVAFDKAARLVRLLRGRARFDVVAARGAPFMVEAGDRLILDRGTVFDVAVGRDGVNVALLRGAVEIRERAAVGRAGRVIARLAPGQRASGAVGSDTMPVAAAPAGGERWVEGVLSYDGARLADVVADLARYAPHRLRLADPTLGDLRVTGVFPALPIDNAAEALAAALRLRVVTAGNGDLILTR